MDKNKEKKTLFGTFKYKLILIIMITIVVCGATTYGFFYSGKSQTSNNTLTTGCFDVTFGNEGSSINLTNAISMSDASGRKVSPYTFTLTNNCDTESSYYVILSTKENSFSNDFVNVSVNNDRASTLSANRENSTATIESGYDKSYIIASGSVVKDNPLNFEIRAWINTNATYDDVKGKTWEGQIKVVNTVK